MSHDQTKITDAELLRDLEASLHVARTRIGELQRDEGLPWRYEVAVLGSLIGSCTSMAEVLRRTKPPKEIADSAEILPNI